MRHHRLSILPKMVHGATGSHLQDLRESASRYQGSARASANALLPEMAAKPSSLLDTRVIYCLDNLEQLQKLPPACGDYSFLKSLLLTQ